MATDDAGCIMANDMNLQTLQAFEEVTNQLVTLLWGMDEALINKKPVDGGWSPGQIADHIRKSYASAETMDGASESGDRSPNEKIDMIKKIFTDDTIRMKSPDAIIPTEKPVDTERLMAGLQNRIEQMAAVIRTKDLSDICTDYAIPQYGPFTRLEWAWFNIYHTERHIRQLKKCVKDFN